MVLNPRRRGGSASIDTMIVLSDPVLDPGLTPRITHMISENVQDTTPPYDANYTKIDAALAAMPSSTEFAVLDLETGWLDTPAVMLSRNADAAAVLAYCKAARPSVKFSLYGFPVTTGNAVADDGPGGWHPTSLLCPGWQGDFLAPSIYNASTTADPPLAASASLFALQIAIGERRTLPFQSHREYAGFALVPPDQIGLHVEGAMSAIYGGRRIQGVIFWRSDSDYRAIIEGLGEIPTGVSFEEWTAYLDARTIAQLRNTVLGETNVLPDAPT